MNSLPRTKTKSSAFTRVELLAVLAALALLAAVALPALAHTQPQTRRVLCANNLRQLGQGVARWASDHDDQTPWTVYYSDGGTRVPLNAPPDSLPSWAALRNNVWFQYGALSNELSSARVLACPSDATRRAAADFSSDRTGGFFNVNYRNNAVSYLMVLHTPHTSSPYTYNFIKNPRTVLAADRNMHMDSTTTITCALGLQVAYIRSSPAFSAWLAGLHSFAGNVVLADGGVEQVNSAGLSRLLNFDNSPFGSGDYHLILP